MNAGSVLSSASLDAENKVLRTRKLAALHLSFGVVRYDAGVMLFLDVDMLSMMTSVVWR